jgi:hypothetical protein
MSCSFHTAVMERAVADTRRTKPQLPLHASPLTPQPCRMQASLSRTDSGDLCAARLDLIRNLVQKRTLVARGEAE